MRRTALFGACVTLAMAIGVLVSPAGFAVMIEMAIAHAAGGLLAAAVTRRIDAKKRPGGALPPHNQEIVHEHSHHIRPR
jgi:hypothetical protein